MLEKIKETTDHINGLIEQEPTVGIILGTGLGGLVREIEVDARISYGDIPNFPVSTVEGHSGQLIFGKLGNKSVVAMQGRFHYYEGYSMQEVTFPIRVFKMLGVSHLIVSNASGGVDPSFEIGDMMIQTDHIDLFPESPLTGMNIDELGPRFPDMSEPYDREMISRAKKIAIEEGLKVVEGTYAGVTGPALETPAEYKYVQVIGANAVGMSTVPEVIVGRHMSLRCFAVSIITDLGVEGKIVKVTHEDVQAVAELAEPKMTKLITRLIDTL